MSLASRLGDPHPIPVPNMMQHARLCRIPTLSGLAYEKDRGGRGPGTACQVCGYPPQAVTRHRKSCRQGDATLRGPSLRKFKAAEVEVEVGVNPSHVFTLT
ncbi:hypothetical protein FVEG_06903 [Fusarium verticillioides 7600]|uniref:Uncharacterized protein n=1 Tax=Gibberella moniliformis (strain M3125 / FGSC 7600) TaxID=334819 RepID=W7MFH4_GIBM7|nr:hypothetical protein FVEG_06903 [Fusarium verticillioides 7600]EWG46384.1 hypothetical protein FVEG_06903 [Fusarium verticillioides 7600]